MFQRSITRQSKKALLISLLVSVTGCASLQETVIGSGNTHYGYAPEDPCIRCGESWIVLPNQDMAALRHPSNQKPDSYWEAKLEEMYGPDWRSKTPNWKK